MKIRGFLQGISKNWKNNRLQITLELTEGNAEDIETLNDKDLSIELKQYRKSRSLNANAMLWACLGEISAVIGTNKWDLYLQALKNYGQYTMIEIEPEALKKFKSIYRECEDVGAHTVNGKEMRQVLCYYGSSTYNTAEFSRLLDGVIDDMKQAGIPTPTSEEMKRALEAWEHDQKT